MEIRIREWLLGGLLLTCLGSTASAAGVVFDLSYVDQVQEISPITANYATNQHIVVTLREGNCVTEQHGWQSPKSAGKYGTEGAIGAAASAGQIKVTWHVENQNSLIRYAEYPQHIDTVHLMVSGQSCQATISRRLKPGFSTYERFNRDWSPVFFSSLTSSEIACRVISQ